MSASLELVKAESWAKAMRILKMAFRTAGRLVPLFLILCEGAASSADGRADSQRITGTPNSSASQIKPTPDAKQREAREIVEKYWSSAPENRYALLAESHKQDLKRFGIRDATAYAKETQNPERVWRGRTYQKIDVSRNARQNRDVAQVVVLVEWEQEGYQGVMTYIFDLVVEDARWKIGFIMH